MRGTLIALAAGGIALLGVGIWLGGQRAAADQPHVISLERPAPAALRATRPLMPTTNRTISAAMPGLDQDLRDPDPKVRRNAIAELASTEDADPATLLAASRDANVDVALAGTEGLGALYRDGKLGADQLVARATDANAPAKVRVVAINGLGLVPSPESATALAELVQSSDDYAKRSAAILLVHQDPAIAVPALIGALRDSDENTRSNAHESLRTLARGRDLGDDAGAWQRWWASRAGATPDRSDQ
jgi:HEAT repeat protein